MIGFVVTMGYGTGSFTGGVNKIPTLGYGIGTVAELVPADYARLSSRVVASRLTARNVAVRVFE